MVRDGEKVLLLVILTIGGVFETDSVIREVFDTLLVVVRHALPEGVFDLLGVDVTVFVETPVTVPTD